MLLCHFAKTTSVRDISNGMCSVSSNLNHLGVGQAPSKSSISYQNKRRDATLFQDIYYSLLNSLGQQIGNVFVKIELQKWLDRPFEDPPKVQNQSKQGVLFPDYP